MKPSLLSPRPPLIFTTPVPAEEVCARIEAALADPATPVRGTILGSHVELLVAPRARHFWSPWFSGRVHETPGGGALVKGRFGPHPHLWTGFVAAYALAGIGGAGALVYGLAQWTLDRPPWALSLLPVALLAAAVLNVAARLGQRLGHDQADLMERLVREAAAPTGSPRGARAHPSDRPDRAAG